MNPGTAVPQSASLPELKSVSVLRFGPNNVLFLGDSQTATLFAFELGDVQPATAPQFYNLNDLDSSIAELLGAPRTEITLKGLAVHPVSGDAYLAVHRGHGEQMLPVVLCINAKRELSVVELSQLPHTQATLPNPIEPQVTLRNHIGARQFTITALSFHDGEVFVSGLSNAEFSSTLYRIPYPFRDKVARSSIEMYHAMHAENETRAPIQAMAIVPLSGKPHVLAAYTCTPLVTIAVDALTDGAHVRAKTIGELGFGNTPIDVLPFVARDMKGQSHAQVLITHKHRGPMLFSVSDLEGSNAKDGFSTGVGQNVVAPPFMAVPLSGLLHVADQDAKCLLGLRRDLDTGGVGLLSFEKGLYFRVTEFVSEYQMPGYTYQQPQFEKWQAMKRVQEGID
jgi:hypothetical protein